MTLQFASDLHLEFPKNREFLQANPLKPIGDILVLAGDIVPFAQMDQHKAFFRYLSRHFETTYWLPGNHEYYYYDLAKKSGVLEERILPNVLLVNNITVQREGLRLLFSTLWSKISPPNEWLLERNVSDFQAIRYGNYRLSAQRFNELHEASLAFLSAELAAPGARNTAVITHHVPTLMHYPEQYKDSLLNEAFAVELSGLIADTQPGGWIYGHHHSNTPEFRIGATRLLTNQLGYVHLGENRTFNPAMLLEL